MFRAFGGWSAPISEIADWRLNRCILDFMAAHRETVDLTAYPNLVVIYLGMRVQSLRGLKTLVGFGPKISRAVAQKPDGLLLHENIIYSLAPPHAGMRQYWRDFESLERWARSLPHQEWWLNFLRDPGGTGFWHETYFMRGGMEAIYDDVDARIGFGAFAPVREARGPMFSARKRAAKEGEPTVAAPVREAEYYGDSQASSR